MNESFNTIKEKINKFMVKNLMFGEGAVEDHQPLFSTGVLDSLGFVKLLAFIEKEFGVSLDARKIQMEKFDTVYDIAKFVTEGLKRKP